jgi:ParB family chromosome partitioning protein|tara:strand:- start:8588 stop:9442 length:855 start_codon:yes stop_codon:yes gene_type:complete
MINPFKNKKGLGRGLSSLIGDSGTKVSNNKISISSILPNKFQPRKNFQKESLEELSKSIKERGIIQPLIVRNSEDDKNKFELIAGERRLQASQMAGFHEVPAIIIEADNLKSLEFAIVENVQRKDLNPIEEAEGYKRLIDDFGYDQDKVSKFIGKSRSHISNSIRLLSLPKNVRNYIENETLSQGHAKILVGLDNSEILADRIIKKKLSVRQAENLVRILKSNKVGKRSSNKNPDIIDLENSIEEKTGLKTFISNKKNNSGQLIFEYKGLDQLNRLIEIIKSNY